MSPHHRKARAIKRVGLEKGWTLRICDRPANRRLGTQCTNVASISRQSPEIALKLAEAVNRIAESRRGKHKGRLSAEDILADLDRDPELLGCHGSGRKRGAVYLAGRDMGSMASTKSRSGVDRRVGKACDAADDGGKGGVSIATAVGDWRDAVSSERKFYEDWLDESEECGSNGGRNGGGHRGNTMMQGSQDEDADEQARADADAAQEDAATDAARTRDDANNRPPKQRSQIRVFVGKVWAKITPNKKWKADTKNGGTGGRGYCFADTECANTCHGNAMARALAKELADSRYTGCNDNATPTPDSTNTCYEVLNADRLTGAMREQLWREACAARGGVEHACADPSMCSVQCMTPDEFEVTERSFDACGDPRAMCGPDDVGGWPGEEPPQPETGPSRNR